jgi:hypothetical protein
LNRAVIWVTYAFLAWLVLNALAYPSSYLIPDPATPKSWSATPAQNFAMVLVIELVGVILFADVLRIKRIRRMKEASPGSLVGTVVDFEYPLFITAAFLIIEIVAIYRVAF